MSTLILFITIAAWAFLPLSLWRAVACLSESVKPVAQAFPPVAAGYIGAAFRALVVALICAAWLLARWVA